MTDTVGIGQIPLEPFPKSSFYFDGIKSDVRGGVSYAQSKIDNLQEDVLNIIENMQSIATNFEPEKLESKLKDINVSRTNFPKISLQNVVLDTVLPSFPVRPNFQEVGVVNFDIQLPEKPSAYNGTYLEWNGTRYASDIEKKITSFLLAQLANGQFGIPDLVADSIMQRQVRFVNDDYASKKRDAFYRFAFTGQRVFAAEGVEVELEKQRAKDILSISDKIIEEKFNAYLKDKEIILSVSVEIEKIASQNWNWFEQRDFESKAKAVEIAVELARYEIEQYTALVEAEIKKWSLVAQRIETIAKLNDSLASVYETDGRVWAAYAGAKSDFNTAKVRQVEAQASAQASAAQAAAAESSAELGRADLELRKEAAALDAELKNLGYNLDGKKAFSELSAKILESQVQPLVQLVASMLGMINIGMSENFSGSSSYGQSHGISVGYGENVSFSPGETAE